MGTLTRPYTFTAGTFAVAAQVNADLDVVYNWINGGSGMWADGSTAFSGTPLLPNTDPSNVNHATRKRYVDNKFVAAVPVTGPRPTAPIDFRIQAGYLVGQTDSGGRISVTFPQPFTTAVFAVVGSLDNTNASNPAGFVQPFNVGLASCGFQVFGATNGVLPNTITINAGFGGRIHWVAIGY